MGSLAAALVSPLIFFLASRPRKCWYAPRPRYKPSQSAARQENHVAPMHPNENLTEIRYFRAGPFVGSVVNTVAT